MIQVTKRIFSQGYRVFFLGAGLFAVFAGAVWAIWLAGDGLGWSHGWPSFSMPPLHWHGHEMIFGYATAALGGFLLTAVPNWTGANDARAQFVAAVAVVWIAGRVAVWMSGTIPQFTVALIDLAFLPLLISQLAIKLIRRPKPQNLIFVLFLSLLWCADLMVHLDWLGRGEDFLERGMRGGLLVLCGMMSVLGGRVTPAFTRNAMRRAAVPESAWPVSLPRLDVANIGLALILPVLVLTGAPDVVQGGIACLFGALQLLRLSRWRGLWAVRQPILIALHSGMAMLGLGLLLWGAAKLGVGDEVAGLHLLGIGAVGGMTMAVMSRAVLGHSGRALVAPSPVAVAYALVPLAALLRWLAPTLEPGLYLPVLLAASAFWVLGFGLYIVALWPAFAGPRGPGG